MPAFLADHNFNEHILEGLARRGHQLDVIRARTIGLTTASDDEMLKVAAELDRVILTHDKATLVPRAFGRVADGLRMPGVVVVRATLPIGQSIEGIELRLECLSDSEWSDEVQWVP